MWILYLLGQTGREPGLFNLLLPFILIFLVLYLLLILPQRRQQKEHQKMLESLKKGDKVILTSGIHGTIEKVEKTTCVVRISQKTEITVDKSAIARKLSA